MSKNAKSKELRDNSESISQEKSKVISVSLQDLKTDTRLKLNDGNTSQESSASKKEVVDSVKISSLISNQLPEKKISLPEIPTKPSNVETRVEIIKTQVTFERNQLYLEVFKTLSFAFAIFIFDMIMHFYRFYEGVDVLKIENYESFFFGDDLIMNLGKVVGVLLAVHLTTPKGKIVVNSRGIYCESSKINSFFYSTNQKFLTWDEIKAVRYKIRFFEQFLFFYSDTDSELGKIDFTIDAKKDFFKFIEKNAGRNHPLVLVQKDVDLT